MHEKPKPYKNNLFYLYQIDSFKMQPSDIAMKRQMMESYLKQQAPVQPSPTPSVAGDNAIIIYNQAMNADDLTLEQFKNFVKKWLEYDNYIKKAQELIREKRQARDKLSQVITKFMCKYNIEDLNTKEGRIRCKTTYVKAPVNHKVVKERISDYFKGNENQKQDILTKIYDEREKQEKVSLRRLKIS